MDREKIVNEFFKRGHLLTEDAIKVLEDGYEHFLGKELPLVVEAKDLQQPFKIIKNLEAAKKEISSEDFVKFYNSKYEKMKGIILSRVPRDFVSLNNAGANRNEVHVLGIVKDIEDRDGKKSITLEDPTGSTPVVFEPAELEDVELDDVIAVRAIAGGRVLYGKKVIFPDIPLRAPSTGTGKGCFVSDFRLDEASTKDAERFFQWFSQQDIPYLFVAGDLGNKELFEQYVDRYCYIKTVFVIAAGEQYPQVPFNFNSRRIISLSNPALLEVGGLKVLMAHRGNVTCLKKRYLGKSSIILEEDYLALEDVPDIMHTGHGEVHVSNYKSVTIVNGGSLLAEFKPIVIDFATREVEKITL